jgi:hypothetical protein
MKRLDAGMESADEILRLATGRSPAEFAEWQIAVEAIIDGQG